MTSIRRAAPWGLLLALFCLAVAVAGCSSSDDTVEVPDVVGLAPDKAVAVICDAGLVAGDVTSEQGPTSGALAMRVVSTAPAAGVKVSSGSAVDVHFRLTGGGGSVAAAVPVRCDLVAGQ